ncbi:MAG: calcium/sodium antiporter [Oscillospiraceae bacterium]|nr:calcium/sodium antiporter [Oscillospiraceae bacterium]
MNPMNPWLAVLLFIIGLALVIKGGDFFVDASVWVSDVSGIPKAVIGATLVSFATTAPELFTSLIATVQGSNGIAVGNAVGSPIANIGLGFALIAVATPGSIRDKLYSVKSVLMIAAAGLLFWFSQSGKLVIWQSCVLFALFFISMVVNIKFSKDSDSKKTAAKRPKPSGREKFTNIAKFIIGAAGIIFGAKLLVDSGTALAKFLGWSETVIGLTIVAIGTSLPEIVTAITAVIKKQNALSIGNIIGANVLDLTMILAICGLVSGGTLTIEAETARTDMPISLIIMALAAIPTAIGKKIYRWQGILIFLVYAAYLVLITLFPGAYLL